jgi:signal transduction histidine kinase
MPEVFATQDVFKRLLLRSVVLPISLMILLAAALVWQINNLIQSATWVEASNQVIARANRLEKLHLDLETGVRGFLITHDQEFLRPYADALQSIPRQSADLTQSLTEQPAQQQIIDRVAALREQWLDYARGVIHGRETNDIRQQIAGEEKGKHLMDSIREQFDQFVTNEDLLRTTRSHTSESVALISVVTACGLALIIGTLIALLSRRQLEFLSKNYEGALATSAQVSANLELRVTERTEELATANDALTEVNRELEAFSYSISHDLRAPLRHIEGFAELLRADLGDDIKVDAAENLNTINETAKLAGKMVDDVLRLSRIGRAQLSTTLVDMSASVEECRADLGPDMEGRQVQWRIHPLPPIRGDKSLLKLVVQNLLGNAIKYSSKAEVAEIEVGAIETPEEVTYWVKDNGVGFNMEYANKLFGVFQRLHRAEEFEGTGIGLANVRRIILRHGGRVWADAEPNKGATFYFALPKVITKQ